MRRRKREGNDEHDGLSIVFIRMAQIWCRPWSTDVTACRGRVGKIEGVELMASVRNQKKR